MKYYVLTLLFALFQNIAYPQSSLGVRFSSDSINAESKFGLLVLSKDNSIQLKKRIISEEVIRNIPSGDYILKFYKVGCVRYESKIHLKDMHSSYPLLKPKKLDDFYSLSNDYSLIFVDSSYRIWEIIYQNMNKYKLLNESVDITPSLEIKEVYWHGFLYDTIDLRKNSINSEFIFDKLIKLESYCKISTFLDNNDFTLSKIDNKHITLKDANLFGEDVGDFDIYFDQDSLAFMSYIEHFDDLNQCVALYNLFAY